MKLPSLKELKLSTLDVDLLTEAKLYFAYFGEKEISFEELNQDQKNWINARLNLVNRKQPKINKSKINSMIIKNFLNERYDFERLSIDKKVITIKNPKFIRGRQDIDEHNLVNDLKNFLKRNKINYQIKIEIQKIDFFGDIIKKSKIY